MSIPDSVSSLETDGYTGFLTVGQLHRSGCFEVPEERGLYVALARSEAPHGFLSQSTAPVWRGLDPTLPVEALTARWVEGACLLYVGRAPGPGVRTRLRQRIKRLLRFGHGSVVAHWDGRLLWQLRESSRLVIAWRVCNELEDPARLEVDLLARFERTYGALPFANSREDSA